MSLIVQPGETLDLPLSIQHGTAISIDAHLFLTGPSGPWLNTVPVTTLIVDASYTLTPTIPINANPGDRFAVLATILVSGTPVEDVWLDAGQVAPVVSLTQDLTDQLDAITAKTNLIGSANATVRSPVTEKGELPELIVGDDYHAADGRALSWEVPASTWGDLTGADVAIGFVRSDGLTSLGPFEGIILNQGTEDQLLQIDLSLPLATPTGRYRWDVEVKNAAGRRLTRITGETTFRPSRVQTP